MRPRTRTLVAWLAAMALLAAACGGDAATDDGDTTTTPAAGDTTATTAAGDTTTTAAEADTTTTGATEPSGELVVWHYFATPGQVETLDTMADLFNEKYPNVTVVYEEQPFDQMTPGILTASAAQDGPDVIIYQWGDVLKLVEAGTLTSMEPYFASWEDANQIPDSVVHRVSGIEYDPESGDVYTINPYVNLIALYYNKEILDSVGIAPPTTLEELTAALAAVTDAGFRGLTMDASPGVGGWWGGMPWVWAHGGDITMSDQAATESAFSLVKSYVDAGYISPDVVTFDQQTAMVQWLTGDYAFTINGNWELTRVIDEAGFEWDVVQMPAGPAGSSVYLGGEGIAIGAFTDQPDLAWDYLQTTWLSVPGQIAFVENIGSIPARLDLAGHEAITSGTGLEAFVASVASGHRLPITQGENAAQTLFGDTWSAVVSGQTSPADAAASVFAETPGLLNPE